MELAGASPPGSLDKRAISPVVDGTTKILLKKESTLALGKSDADLADFSAVPPSPSVIPSASTPTLARPLSLARSATDRALTRQQSLMSGVRTSEEDVYEPLLDEGMNMLKAARIHCTTLPTVVTLNSERQHTLEWDTALRIGGDFVEAGKLNLYTYPGGYTGPQLAILRLVMLEIATKHVHLLEVADPVGAFVMHAIMVCNTEASLELSMAIFEVQPRLLLQTHAGQPFLGEGHLHIACANRREQLACRMVALALQHFSLEDARAFLNTQALGVFFDDEPMRWYGETPLSYACVFGLRILVRHMLETKLVMLNDGANCGHIIGYFPLHAVSVNGLRGMYDFLTSELPAAVRADSTQLTVGTRGRLVHLDMDGMTPLQLTAKRGLRVMFQHIMKKEHTKTLWVWGPVTQYQISLDGIDSSGRGASNVMEVLARSDASPETVEFILDNFMKGFIFALFVQKWDKFGWYMHLVMRTIDLAVVMSSVMLCTTLKSESETKRSHADCVMLLVLLGAFLAVELFIGALYATNFKSGVPPLEVLRRTWEWMNDFASGANLLASALITFGISLYLADTETEGFVHTIVMVLQALLGALNYVVQLLTSHFTNGDGRGSAGEGGSRGDGSLASMARRLDEFDAFYTADRMAQRSAAVVTYNIEGAEAAAWEGIEPLIWLFLGLGFLIKFYAFVDQFVQPYTSLSIFVLSVRQVMRGELMVFMCIFVIFISAFVFTMITVYPDHPAAGKLPQSSQMMHWVTGANAILIAGFTGEPLDLNLHPDYLAPLGLFQKINFSVFYIVYIVYIFFSLILLLNLLIALLGSTFSKTQVEAQLQGRLAFARIVLRLERVADFWGINTNAGEPDGANWVHNFRAVQLDKDVETTRFQKSEDVFFMLTNEAATAGATAEGVATARAPVAKAMAAAAPVSASMLPGLVAKLERSLEGQMDECVGVLDELAEAVMKMKGPSTTRRNALAEPLTEEGWAASARENLLSSESFNDAWAPDSFKARRV